MNETDAVWAAGIDAITLFVEDLPAAREFYERAFGLPVHFEDEVDSTCDMLRARGVELLNGPMDRPWGVRTAAFRDPAGHVWEIAR